MEFSSEGTRPSAVTLGTFLAFRVFLFNMGIHIMRAFATFVLCLAAQAAIALDAQSINDAKWSRQTDGKGMSPVVAKAQILLDRAHFSPGALGDSPGLTAGAIPF